MTDLVSTVIPTRNRPSLVLRAVRSALNQTFRSTEVIVVLDGPDEKTAQGLAQIDDPRVLPLLKRERGRKGGLFNLEEVNGCMNDDLKNYIARYEKN